MSPSFINFSSFKKDEINVLIDQAFDLKSRFYHNKLDLYKKVTNPATAALLFFEPSTRTRFSFETACVRAGIHPLVIDGLQGTSLEKGETFEDTILSLEAMRPLFFVVRAPDGFDMLEISKLVKTPILNAGWGKRSHPTQALLDAATLIEDWGSDLAGKRLLFLGDIKHSRVVQSHLELAQILGYHVGFCAPENFLPDFDQRTHTPIALFSNLKNGLEWADAVVALRIQKERHQEIDLDLQKYRETFGLNQESLKQFKTDGLILHPGPVNYGIEIEKSVTKDPRSRILQLVENGVFIRESLIRQILTGLNISGI